MTRTEFMAALRDYIENPPNWGTPSSARMLEEYILGLNLSGGEDNRHWTTLQLPQIILRRSYDGRRRRNQNVKFPSLDLFDARDTYEMVERATEQSQIANFLQDVTGSEYTGEIVDKYLRADHFVIMAKFVQFAQETYANGLYDAIVNMRDNDQRPVTFTTFGTTTFRTLFTAGRIMMTLHRKDENGFEVGLINFMTNDDDPLGYSGSLTSQYSGVETALSMINDVITGWIENPTLKASKAYASN